MFLTAYRVFHGDYLYTKLVLYLFLLTVQTKDKYLQNPKRYKQKTFYHYLKIF